MAMSGRKLSDFSGSLSYGSAEDVDHFCEPCLTTGHQLEAYKYCVDCEEYMCRTCSDCHLRTKITRNHQLVGEDKVGKLPSTQGSEVRTNRCPEHRQEVIKYFCWQHEALGCHVCMTMQHRLCEINYIPDKCADIANSEEYRRTVYQLDLKLQELNHIKETTEVRDQEIDKCHHNLLQEISKFRKEINDYLDQLQQNIQKEVDKKKTEDKQITKRILDGCNRLSSDIKKMQSILQATKTSGKYDQLFISVKQAQSLLRLDEIKAEDGLERTAQQYVFEHNNSLMNNSLMNMLSKSDAFGKLSLTSVLRSTRRKTKTIHKLTEKEDINVRTESDKYGCGITGCTVLSPDKLVLADRNNCKLKLVNVGTKSVVQEISLDSKPWVVAAQSQDQIAVTMPNKRQIVLMACEDRMSTVRTISVKGRCTGIIHNQGQLYVLCQDPLCVLILTKQGNVQSTLSLNTFVFSDPNYLEVSEDSKLLYISDYMKKCIVSITLHGEVTAVYKHEDLVGPLGMFILDDQSLLVCSFLNNSIHCISGDLKHGEKMFNGLKPYSICYNHHLHEVYIGGNSCDQLTVLIPE